MMKAGFGVAGLVLAAIVTFSITPPASAQLDPNQGREILNRSCTSCHQMRQIEVQAMDSEEWLATINQMLDNGAEFSTIEQLILLDYLVRNHGPIPDGDGRELLLNRCTVCHSLDRVRAHQGTPALWQDAVQTMLNEGAYLTDPEYAILVDYLTEHFGPEED
jgi:mono/diheme cytochrome c family protein